MKKLISVVLTISLIFLIGCSSLPIENETTTQAPVEPTGFVEMDIDFDYIQNAYSICTNDDLIVFMTSIVKDADGNIVHPQSEDDYLNTTDTQYIVEYNAKENKLINIFEIKECPITEIWGIELENERIVIYSNSEKKNAYYDLDMNLIEESERTVVDDLETAKKSSYYTEMSAACDGYCYFNGDNHTEYMFFYDNPEELYIFNADKAYQPNFLNKENGYILSETFGDNGEKTNFNVIDYKNANEVNTASIFAKDYGYEYCSTNSSGFGNKYAVCLEYFGNNNGENNEDYTYRMFYWNYQNEKTNTKLDIKKQSNIEALYTQSIAEIKETYGVDIRINEIHENIEENVKCDEEINPLIIYNDIEILRAFFESLPEGMLKEAYSGFYDEGFEADGIRVDIVSEINLSNDITNEAAAFAQQWSDPMEACFAYNTVSTGNVAHEFMHLFDHRIDDYLNEQGTSLYDAWYELNKDFDHEYDESEEFHRQFEFDENNFISEYASSNNEEDRAVTFEYLYNSHADDNKSWLEYEGVKTKADYLTKLLREAFPSVAQCEKAYWE